MQEEMTSFPVSFIQQVIDEDEARSANTQSLVTADNNLDSAASINTLLFIGVAIIVVAIIGAGLYFAVQANKTDQPTA